MRVVLAAVLGAATALPIACSGSGGGLIPAANAGPLRADFEAVARAAESGNGKCAQTEAAISHTEVDFAGLPASINSELREALRRGIANLRAHALELCTQPLPQATTAVTSTPTQTTKTATTPTTSTPTTTETTTTQTGPAGPGGGTPAEEAPAEQGGEEPRGKADGKGKGGGKDGGQEAGK